MKKGDRLNLRHIEEKDIEWLRETRNKYKDNFFDSSEISVENQRAWYKNYRENTGIDHMFIVELKDKTPIGTIAIYAVDIASRTAKLGRVLLIEDYRGHGYAEEAVKLAVDIAINDMRLFKIRVEVFQDNLDALSIYHKAGFKTGSRPVILLEKISHNLDWNKPVVIE